MGTGQKMFWIHFFEELLHECVDQLILLKDFFSWIFLVDKIDFSDFKFLGKKLIFCFFRTAHSPCGNCHPRPKFVPAVRICCRRYDSSKRCSLPTSEKWRRFDRFLHLTIFPNDFSETAEVSSESPSRNLIRWLENLIEFASDFLPVQLERLGIW